MISSSADLLVVFVGRILENHEVSVVTRAVEKISAAVRCSGELRDIEVHPLKKKCASGRGNSRDLLVGFIEIAGLAILNCWTTRGEFYAVSSGGKVVDRLSLVVGDGMSQWKGVPDRERSWWPLV